MDAGDQLIIRLQDDALRASLLDDDALRSLIDAAFIDDSGGLQPPYSLKVERSEVAVEIAPPAILEGRLEPLAGGPIQSVRINGRIPGLGRPLRADILWRGALIARRARADAFIQEVETAFPSLDIDRALRAQGPLPANPAALETSRRAELLRQLKAAMRQPSTLDEAGLNAILAAQGAQTVDELMRAAEQNALGVLRIRFSPPALGPPTPVMLPVTIAVAARAAIGSLVELMGELRAVRAGLDAEGTAPADSAEWPRRTQVVSLLALPKSFFDTPLWPGADAASRIASARRFFSTQATGLALAQP